jgi:predicted RecA/RadA family phage recombinase
MATNLVQDNGEILAQIAATHPAAPLTGAPVRVGALTGVALTDEAEGGNGSGQSSIDFGMRVWNLTVDDNEGTGIAIGATIYYHDTGTGTGSVNLNNSSSGANGIFGIALGAVSANATTAIDVLHVPTL